MERLNVLRLSYLFTSKLGVLGLAVLLAFSSSVLYLTFAFHTSPKPTVGIVYYYDRDDSFTIVSELQRIKADGFSIVCIPIVWNDNPQAPSRVKTDLLYEWAEKLHLKVYVRLQLDFPSTELLEKYLGTYGSKISYFQAVNEADAQFIKTWNVPGQIVAFTQNIAETTKKFNPQIKTVATFATPLLPNLITQIAPHVDIIGLDIYEQIQLDTFPIQMQTLLTLSGKHAVWISEFGHATLDDQAQANFIQKGLTLFEKNGVETVVIWQWKHDPSLKIKDRQAETTIKNWVEET